MVMLVGALAALSPVCAATAGAEDPGRAASGPKRVLLIHSFGQQFEPLATAATTFRTELARRSPVAVEYSEISLEAARFSEGDAEQPLADYVRVLKEHRPPDLVVAVGSPALRFCARHRHDFFSSTPLLALGVEERHLAGLDLGDSAAAVAFRLDLTAFLEDLLSLLPRVTHVAVVFGGSPLEGFWVEEARRAWEGFAGRIEFVWLNHLPMAGMLDRVAALPEHSAVVFGLVSVDADGVPYERDAALQEIRRAANAPVFGLFEPQVGVGIVGGRLVDVRALGEEAARMAVPVLEGAPLAAAARVVPSTGPVFDWRELRRWGILETALPAGSEVRFRRPTFWDLYKWRMALVAAVVASQAALIVLLLRSRMRLRSTRSRLVENEANLNELRRDLAHAGRVSLLGQVTASLAHELGQPLGAILRNAEAAEFFMNRPDPDLDELRAILDDIRRDGARAGAVIERLRALLERRAVDMQTLAWSEVVEETMGIVRGDARARAVDLRIDTPPGLPRIRGDRVQLQQVLINLVANAMDAVEEAGPGARRITLRTRANGDGFLECGVSDTGAGIGAGRAARIFEPYVTTKPHGMGMGLPIARTIIEAHGGKLWVADSGGPGTTFRFTLPVGEA